MPTRGGIGFEGRRVSSVPCLIGISQSVQSVQIRQELREKQTAFFFSHRFPDQLVGGSTTNGVLNKRWLSNVRRSLLSPVLAIVFIPHRVQLSHCSSIFIEFCQPVLLHSVTGDRRLRKNNEKPKV